MNPSNVEVLKKDSSDPDYVADFFAYSTEDNTVELNGESLHKDDHVKMIATGDTATADFKLTFSDGQGGSVQTFNGIKMTKTH